MKKKIVNAVLMAALVVPSVGTLTSCKDYNEDLSVELRGETANLRKTLQDQIDDLKAKVAAIKSCQCDLSDFVKSADLAAYVKQADLDAKLAGYQRAGDYVTPDMIANFITKGEADAAYLTQDQLQTYVNEITNNLVSIEILEQATDQANARIDSLNAVLGNLNNVTSGKNLAEYISEMNNTIITVNSLAQEAMNLASNAATKEELAALTQRVEKIEGWEEKLTKASTDAADALAKATENALWIEKNKENVEKIEQILTDLNELKNADLINRVKNLEDNYMKKDDIQRLFEEAKAAADAANTLAEQAMAKAGENAANIDTNAKNISKNAEDIAAINEKLANYVTNEALAEELMKYVTTEEFQKEMAEVNEDIQKVADKVDELDAEITKVKKDQANLITGIITQATENPVLGYFKTPFGIDQNVIATYYGTADKGIEFPARDGKFYLEASDVDTWTPRNLEVMGISNLNNVKGYFTKGDEVFVTEVNGMVDGNAGTVYVTVNPSNVNFNGQQLALETSASNVSPFILDPLKYSTKELMLGIYRNGGTRGYENGFYSAKATLRAEDVDKAKFVIDFKTIGDAVKNVIKDGPQDARTRISVAESAAMVFGAIKNEVPAYGLKASWTDSDNKVHNVLSNYNLATVAVKPLSFAFLNGSKWSKVDGFDRMRSVVARVIREVEVARPDFAKYEFQFDNIQVSNGKILAQVYMVNDGSNSELVMIPVEGNADMADVINELVADINANNESANKVLAELFNEVKATYNYETYIAETKASVYTAIDKYLTRIENHILRVMNNAHRTLFITMFGEQNGKFALLSNSVDKPTKAAAGEYTLIPTTYTLQYFAPVYKKFVAVTNVYDAATKQELALGEAQSLAKAANGGVNMFKVVDGLDNCTIKGETGKIYELTYTAVDYHGVVMIKKFYVEF